MYICMYAGMHFTQLKSFVSGKLKKVIQLQILILNIPICIFSTPTLHGKIFSHVRLTEILSDSRNNIVSKKLLEIHYNLHLSYSTSQALYGD